MPKLPNIGSAMTAFPYLIELDDHVAAAKMMLEQFKIHHLPVREGDKIVGVISDLDIRRARALRRDLPGDADLRIGDICNRNVYIVDSNEPLDRVLLHMAEAHIEVACVVNGGKLGGIFTSTDAFRQFAGLLRTSSNKK